jgi:hypothetical protein
MSPGFASFDLYFTTAAIDASATEHLNTPPSHSSTRSTLDTNISTTSGCTASSLNLNGASLCTESRSRFDLNIARGRIGIARAHHDQAATVVSEHVRCRGDVDAPRVEKERFTGSGGDAD